MAKDKKAKKGKAAPPQTEWPLISVAEHPRAQRSIRRSKAWAGLIAFALVGLLSHRAGVEPFEAVLRALVAGVLVYVAVWAASVALWQRIVLHEAKTEAERRRDEREARMAALVEAQRAQQGQPGGDDGAAVA